MIVENLSAKSLKQLFASSGNQCGVTNCEQVIVDPYGELSACVIRLRQDVSHVEVPDQNQTATSWVSCNDLLLVCPDCNELIAGEPQFFTVTHLRNIKQEHEKGNARACLRSDARIALRLLKCVQTEEESRTYLVDVKGRVTQAPSLHIPPPVELPEMTIGDDRNASSYIAYLILRYNEFAAKELKDSAQFNPKKISQNLKSRYKLHWKDLPRVRFPHVSRYLKHRIDITRIARANTRKGLSSYRSYDSFLRKPQKR